MLTEINQNFEARILSSLDSCLLKMADKLNTSFNPEDVESVKLLKTFRSTLSSRRQWAKEYSFKELREEAILKPEVIEKAKTVREIPEEFKKKAIEDIVAQSPKRTPLLRPEDLNNGLVCRR